MNETPQRTSSRDDAGADKTKIFIVDDHYLVRQGLRAALEAEEDMFVIGEADSGEAALAQLLEVTTDVVLMDITMPGIDGIETLRRLRQRQPDLKVLMLTSHENEYVEPAIEAGASGYLLKRAGRLELANAIREVCMGGMPLDPQVTKALLRRPQNTISQSGTSPSIQQDSDKASAYKVEPRIEAYDLDQPAIQDPERVMEDADIPPRAPAEPSRPPLKSRMSEIITLPGMASEVMNLDRSDASRGRNMKARSRWLAEDQGGSPVIRAVELIIESAIAEGASDVHIEPQEGHLQIRVRVDGTLRSEQKLPTEIHQSLVSRIKVMANMDISEHRIPQDGQFTYYFDGRDVDFRVATIDTNHGEMVVMRLLDKTMSFLRLADIAFRPDILELYRSQLAAPYGMVLVSGPTGSGKTTSLYASLSEYDPSERKIMTVEDPIEYKMPGINQVQVNRQAGMTFSTGLRGILRLDPDVILVGEVRDSETADTAVQAALTGHIVLSSIHANDAAGALLRLVDLGVEPFLINSAVTCSLAQRLVRKPCAHCKITATASVPEIQAYNREINDARTEFEYGAGCEICGYTGYLGRVAVFELLLITDDIRELVMNRATASQIRHQAIQEGMVSMSRDAMLKAQGNLTNPGEVIRKVFTRV